MRRTMRNGSTGSGKRERRVWSDVVTIKVAVATKGDVMSEVREVKTDIMNMLCDYATGGCVVDRNLIAAVQEDPVAYGAWRAADGVPAI
jgi:hypothetical protein